MHGAFQNDHSVYTECTARAREAAGLLRDGMSLGARDTCIYRVSIYRALFIGALNIGALYIGALYSGLYIRVLYRISDHRDPAYTTSM